MPRLPFGKPEPDDPDSAPPAPKQAKGDRPWTITECAARVREALQAGLPRRIRVVGEVSNLSNRNHWFFSLKDGGAAMRCVMFATAARAVRFPVQNGLEVIATGRVDFYDAQGNVQIYVDRLEPVGQGALELQLRELVAELRQLGYFDPELKRPLPPVPRKIAVVTSRSAAALQDVINTAARRWAGCQLVLYDVRVQGADAAPQIAAALQNLSNQGRYLGIDAIILTRGGGSLEDLWAFNERIVADAVYECTLPIVAAIGHETDTTVAELVADVRCATPTQAAMTLIPDREALDHQLHQLSQRLRLVMTRRLDGERHRLRAAARHTLFRNPQRLVDEARLTTDRLARQLQAQLPARIPPARRELATLQRRLAAALPRQTERSRERLAAMEKQLEALGPQNVLKRGYSYTMADDGRLLRSAKDATPGKAVTTVMHDGKFESVVRGEGDAAAPPAPPAPAKPAQTSPPPTPRKPRKKRQRKGDDDQQASLFGG